MAYAACWLQLQLELHILVKLQMKLYLPDNKL